MVEFKFQQIEFLGKSQLNLVQIVSDQMLFAYECQLIQTVLYYMHVNVNGLHSKHNAIIFI